MHILLWAELESCLNTLRIVLYVSGSFFLGDLLGWLFQDAEGARAAVVLALLPLASVGCLNVAFSSIPREDRPASTWGTVRFPWRLVAVLGVYEFVLGFNEATLGADEGTMYLLGTLLLRRLVRCGVFSVTPLRFGLMFRTPFLFVACGLLAAFLSMGQKGAFSEFLVALGYGLMFLILTILLCDIAHRFGVSVLVLCGIEELVSMFMVAGHKVAPLFDAGTGAEGGTDTIRVVLIAVVIAVSAIVLFGVERKQWGAALFGVGSVSSGGSARERLLSRCAVIAEAYHLSPRESEVFQLIALGKSPASIERELCIAGGTLKSHTQRIYQKLGVHSRDELYALVGERPAGR